MATSNSFTSFVSGYNNLSVTGTSRNVSGLSPGTTYYYRIRAVNGGGISTNSGTTTVLTLPAAPVANAASAIGGSSFTATWASVGSATSYRLDVSTTSAFSSTISGYGNLSVSGTSHSVTGLSFGTTYYFRVRAVNGSGTSANSNTVTVVTIPTVPGIGSPSDLAPTSFTANWSSASGSTGYRLDVSASSSFSSFVAGYNNLSVGTTSASVTGLSPGTTYYYRVRAVNGSGTSGNSSTANVLTLPSAPLANTATTLTVNSFTAGWSSVPSATSYRLDVSLSSSFSGFVSGYSNRTVSGTTHTVSGLTPGTTYYFRLRAVNGSGASANSNTVTVLTLPASPVAEGATSLSEGSFTANWQMVLSATGYRLDVSTDASFGSYVAGYQNRSVSGTSHAVSGLSSSTTYYYRVRAVNGSGASANSAVIAVIPAPSVVPATDITNNSFSANWNAVSSATGYRLDVSAASNFASFVEGYESVPVSGTSAQVSGLVPGTPYYYRVRAVVGAGVSGSSAVESLITLLPAPVLNVATSVTETSFSIGWSAVSQAAQYRLDVSTSSDFSDFISGYDNTLVNGTSAIVSGLETGTLYYCRVRAFTSSVTSENSNVQSVVAMGQDVVPLYNGMITSARWRTTAPEGSSEPELKGVYAYSYDDKYQLRMASWGDPDATFTGYTPAHNKFLVVNPHYDPNGNIQSLIRYDGAGAVQHNFNYRYNQRDDGGSEVPGVFNNRLESIDGYAEYHYNKIGQLVSELKTSGDDQYIEYDVSGKVRKVFSDATKTQLKVEYVYDDRGFRLAKVNHDPTSSKTTWYIRDASGNVISTYEQEGVITYDPNGTPQVSSQSLEQKEISVYGAGKLGLYYPDQDGALDYEITDHLGNVRALVREETLQYVASMEDNGQADYTNPRVVEMQHFQNLFETEDDNPYMNHTPAGAVAQPEMAAYLYWKDGMTGQEAGDKAIGPAIALEVQAGDVIRMETWAKFERKTAYSRDFLLATLTSLLGNTYFEQAGFEGMTAAQIGSNFGSALQAAGYGDDGSDDSSPFAYLNYMLLDESLVLVDAGWKRVSDYAGFDPAASGTYGGHEHVTLDEPVHIDQNGYIYIWVSNESEDTRAWFDDLTVTVSTSHVRQATDYGPWGDVVREEKINPTDEYRYGYQGLYSEREEETGYNAFESRMYDPVTGRWTTMDPARVGFSPYIGMGNNPIKFVDPDGRKPLDDWQLNNDGTYTLLKETNDNFHRFFNEDGKLIFQTNWAQADISKAISSWGGTNPANEWLSNFRSLIRTFNLDKNIGDVKRMYARAEVLDFEIPSTMIVSGERARNADLVDLTLSFFDLKPTKGYNPGLAPINEGVKFFTGMSAGKYIKSVWQKFLDGFHSRPGWDPNDPKNAWRPIMTR